MIIWSGLGIVWLFLQLLAASLVMALIAVGLGGFLEAKVGIVIALLVGAATAYYAMKLMLERFGDPGRVLVDPKTGQEVTLRRRDSVFFISCSYWKIIVPVVLVFSAVSSLLVK